ncbi:hypothetical protein HAZT_HAZT009228 [Hyalella azteca]|uniref:Uncharacterized protein LOC108679613 n=1 Tax=Hyalella azteca TaxID=294128 RepID=A0A6A0GSV0_HYAAZ|nr:uncharacterized protein LOC108679613 [Hyalella azteca]KAA0187115.1 hypothetical protein HAZT_HAZT009228 [Hyalella azteca]
MKTAVVFALLVGVAVAQLGAPAAPAAPAAGAPAAGATGNPGNPWGPRAYGMGLNNPWAIPVNPFLMRRALALVNSVPGALVRVDVDGEVAITNQFGQEVDILDGFGNEVTELFD